MEYLEVKTVEHGINLFNCEAIEVIIIDSEGLCVRAILVATVSDF